MATLLDRLNAIYDFIAAYKGAHGYSPALDDIAAALDMDKGTVFRHLETMENLGMILRPRGLLQAIRLRSRQPDETLVVDSH